MPTDRFDALSQAVLAVARAESLDAVLRRVLQAAVDLADARYGALGTPDASGVGFERFLTVGMDDELIARLGELPRTHGMLGAMLRATGSERLDDLTADPRAGGWWPAHHPVMRSFLGVPIAYDGEVAGAIYLTEKRSAARFTAEDQSLVEALAAHAAVAIEQARLRHDHGQLVLAAERDRLGRDLHDALGQTLFSLSLRAATVRDVVRRASSAEDGAAVTALAEAGDGLDELVDLAATARRELRAVVLGLQPPDLAVDGLAVALAKLVDVLASVHGGRMALTGPTGPLPVGDEVEEALWRVAQESLSNAVRHAGASTIEVRLAESGDGVELVVSDDGVGFDPGQVERRGHLGLRGLAERLAAVGGVLRIDSSSEGTTVRATVPVDRPSR